MKKYIIVFLLMATVTIISACSNNSLHQGHDMSKTTSKSVSLPNADTTVSSTTITDNEITLVAKEASLNISEGVSVPVWTFNGSVPGSEIRVKEGENVKIHLKNELPAPVSIHWHGVPVPIEVDGIPGMTMNAVLPSETYTYEFVASAAGTYWYHTHQDGVNQLDRGLYGAFIIEEKDESMDRDYTLILDEWTTDKNIIQGQLEEMLSYSNKKNEVAKDSGDHSAHGSSEMSSDHMGHSNMNGHDMSMYDVYTINGTSASLLPPLEVREGEKVRIRLINAGYLSHNLHLHGHDFKVISTDGQYIHNPSFLKDQLIAIAPGERYDIEFTADNPGEWLLESHDKTEVNKTMQTKIKYVDDKEYKADASDANVKLPVFDLTEYGENKSSLFSLDQEFDVQYAMDLGTAMDNNNMVFTINNKTFPSTDSLNVKSGDKVKVLLRNTSKMDDHPMHLHGHFFQVLSKNGQPVKGSPIIKDTINLKPGDEYMVAFEADNIGNWLFHCHDLHHASAGMVAEVKYTDYKSTFTPDPNIQNKPE